MMRLLEERKQKKDFKMQFVNELRDMPPAERARRIEELCRMHFQIPFSTRTTISRSSIYYWLQLYREKNEQSELLLQKARSDRYTYRFLSEEQKKCIKKWREENAYRTLEELREELLIQNILDARGRAPSESTISRYLTEKNLDRRTLLAQARERPGKSLRLAFEAPYPQRLWQADTKGPHFYVPDPNNPGQACLVKPIVIIDDQSRFLVGARYVFEETEAAVMALLRQAFYHYGICDILYVDRGGPYKGKSLKRAASSLGCRICHTPPRDAQAKGKAESVMKLFYQKLEQELTAKKERLTIEQLNEHMAALIQMEYHTDVHESTKQTPEERYFAYPDEYRRFVSKDVLMMTFLPSTTSKVSTTGIIHTNKLEYMAPQANLFGKTVAVRTDSNDLSRVYVWYRDHYVGEAHLYHTQNDFQKRQELIEQLTASDLPSVPDFSDVPPFSRLERRLAAYRKTQEDISIEEQLEHVIVKREAIKAALLQPGVPISNAYSEQADSAFNVERMEHLLSVLLKRRLDASERLAIHSAWQKYGPFTEALVRREAGLLLGRQCENLTEYLDAMRIAAATTPSNEKRER